VFRNGGGPLDWDPPLIFSRDASTIPSTAEARRQHRESSWIAHEKDFRWEAPCTIA